MGGSEGQSSMEPGFEAIASLGTAATACQVPGASSTAFAAHSVPSSCFDSLACGEGGAPWVAVRTTPCAVQILQGAVPLVVLLVPEPVAAVQLGAAHVTAAPAAGQAAAGNEVGAEAAATVVVVVGESCRVWAWRLHQATAVGGSAAARSQRHRGDVFCPAEEEEEGSGGGGSRRGKRKLGLSSSTRKGAAGQPGLGGAVTAAGCTQQAIPLAPEGDTSSWGMPPWVAAATPPPVLEVQSAPLQQLPTIHTSSGGGSSGSGSGGGGECVAALAELAAAPKLGSGESSAARAQLAAQVVWEYLDALVRQQGCESLGMFEESPTGGLHSSALAVPIPLSKAGAQAAGASTAAGAAPAAVVHSVATWAASHDLPADACCACFLALPPPQPVPCPEFRGSARLDSGTSEPAPPPPPPQRAAGEGSSGRAAAGKGGVPSDARDWGAAQTTSMEAAGQATLGRPLGYLLVGTASGEVAAFPIGTPVGSSLPGVVGGGHVSVGAGSGSGAAGAAGWLGKQRPLAVTHCTRLQLVWLPEGQQAASGGPSGAAAGTESGGALRLVLHAASGTVAPSPQDPCRAVVLAGGSGEEREAAAASDSGGGGEAQQGGILAAVMRVSDEVESLGVQGRMLYYTARGKLHCLDCTLIQQLLGSGSPGGAGGSPQAVQIPTPVPMHLLSTPAATEQRPLERRGSSGRVQELLLLSNTGLLLRMACPSGANWLQAAASRREAVPLAELEQEMQELLGDVAELSASQEAAAAAQAQLDSRLRALSSAIPAVQSINCGTAAGLYCSVRPLYRLAAVVGGGAEGGGCAVEVTLHNGGLWELPAGHSLVVALSGLPPLGSDPGCLVNSRSGEQEEEEDQHCISHSVPLPRLSPGSSHTCTCFLAAPTSGSSQWQAGVLRVLLCHHGTAGAVHAALLHTLRLDPLHFHRPGPSLAHPAPAPGHMGLPGVGERSLGRAAPQHHMQLPASGQAAWAGTPAEVRLRLQLPCWLFGRCPDAGAALAALLDQGLSSLDLSPAPAQPAPGRITGMAGSSWQNWGLAGVSACAGCCQGSAGGPAALGGATRSWEEAAQQERAARQARQRQLAATQLGPSAALPLPLAAGAAGSQAPGGFPGPEGTAWWEPWMLQQRQQHVLPPAAAFSLLPAVPGGAMPSRHSGHGMLFSTAAGAAGLAAGAHPAPSAVVHADFPSSQAAGGTNPVEISARLVPQRGPQAGASWQHAELEITTRSAGVAATLGAHAALVQRVMAMQSSMPEQDPPSGLRLSGSSGGAGALASASASSLGALLVPQDAMSALEAAVEGADEAELEDALCTLRQLKARALALRDEALGLAQQAEQVQQAQQAEGGRDAMPAGQAVGRAGAALLQPDPDRGGRGSSGPAVATAAEWQVRGTQLHRHLQELALALRQQSGSVPVILT